MAYARLLCSTALCATFGFLQEAAAQANTDDAQPTTHEVEETDDAEAPANEPPQADPKGQPGAAKPAANEAPTADVVVHGRRTDPVVGGSDFRIHIGQLRDVPRLNAEHLLTLAPGLLLTNHGGEGHASQIFLRGFNAGEGQDIEFRLEGVPLNEVSNPHGHGYADNHFIIHELVDQLRIVEGPFDPRQGDFAVAGSAYYQLGLHHEGITTKAQIGSYGEKRGLLMWRPRQTTERSFIGFDHRRGDGFGPNRAHASTRLMAQHEFRLGDKTTLTALATGYTSRFDSAGYIRYDDFRANRLPCESDERSQFYCSYGNDQGGASDRQSVSLRLERKEADESYGIQLFGVLRNLRLRQNYTGYVTDLDASGGAQRGDGAEQSYDVVTVGTRGEYRVQREIAGRRQQLEVGYVLRYDDGNTAQRRLRTEGSAPYRTDFDNKFRVTNAGVYAGLNLRPFDRLTVTGGLRADVFGFSVVDHNQPTLDRAGARLGQQSADSIGLAMQPRVGTALRLTRELSWVASGGLGTRSSEAQALSQGEFAPFGRVIGSETGLRAQINDERTSIDSRLIGYYTRVDRDLLFDEQAGRNVLAGRSNRFGAMMSSRVTSRFGLDAQSSLTYSEAYLSPPDSAWHQLTAGDRLPYIPRWVLRTDLSLRRPLRVRGQLLQWMTALGTTYVAPRPLPNNQFSQTQFGVDLAGSVRYRIAELGVQVMNLLDRMNPAAVFNYVSNFRGPEAATSMLPQRHFSAAPPRTVLFSLTLYLGEWNGPAHQD